ncbi:hypothetical protein NEHOM01_1133 [Nematocida homosporus]|uniref:uncharacterized protein n=1 Tax=Nematocida homosporus TaxID=1912981 RepID=UPI00221FB94A|nr:uncharacterized protein NEHOM01_1133 [Nematocida homosporus]KAI5185883.1 hypothetical protein NEHOM01_1133 [Nematocida homosporus]
MARSEFTNELRRMPYKQVEEILSDKKMAILRMRNNEKRDEVKISAEWIQTKRDIARCLTILTEKRRNEIAEEYMTVDEVTGEKVSVADKCKPKFLRKKQPRCARVNMPKEMLERFAQNKSRLRRKVVVFTP